MVGNNPVNLTDALGLMSAEDGKKMAQAVAGKSYLYLAIDGKLETYPQSRYADFCDLAAASGKAFANAAVNSLPFGSDYTLMEPTLLDAMNGYHTTYAISRVGSEFALGYITGYYGTLAFAGKAGFVVRVFRMAMFAMDSSQNLSNVYQGARALSRDPTDMGAWMQFAGGSAGLAGNILGMYRGLSELDGLRKAPSKLAGIRQQYFQAVSELDDLRLAAQGAGQNLEATARMLHGLRREIGIAFKERFMRT